ncbi:MAG: 6-phosphogluconolactonase, partial [Cyclobacteriaceae bacterium]|nr:6-phosphogluconolactonase [Cyclobacteriaceae bacterium]
MEIIKYASYEEMSEAAAQMMYGFIQDNQQLLFCPASGNSPRLAYKRLYEKMSVDIETAGIKVISLDEWGGLDQEDPHCGAYQLNNQLIRPLSLNNWFLFDGKKADQPEEIERAKRYVSHHGPIDLMVLGIGVNGHLGFNEPGAYLEPDIHKATLAQSSRGHQMVAGSDYTPEYGITLGMGAIMHTRKIIVVVNGSHKRDIMK